MDAYSGIVENQASGSLLQVVTGWESVCCRFQRAQVYADSFAFLAIVRICTFNTYENLWVNPSGLHAKLEKETEESGTETPTISNKAKGSIFCVCWDRTGQLLCRGSLDGSMSIVSTYYDPTQPYACRSDGIMLRIQDCPFDITSKDLFGYVFGDKCDVVEAIAVNLSNTAIAYAGIQYPSQRIECRSKQQRVCSGIHRPHDEQASSQSEGSA